MSRKNGRREGRRKTMVDKKTDFGIDMINDVYSGGGIVTLSHPIKTSQQPAGQSSSGRANNASSSSAERSGSKDNCKDSTQSKSSLDMSISETRSSTNNRDPTVKKEVKASIADIKGKLKIDTSTAILSPNDPNENPVVPTHKKTRRGGRRGGSHTHKTLRESGETEHEPQEHGHTSPKSSEEPSPRKISQVTGERSKEVEN